MSTNKWILHVKKYAEENNISYACAITDHKCKELYNPVVKLTKKEKEVVNQKIFMEQYPRAFLQKLVNIKQKPNEEKVLLQNKFNRFTQELKDKIIELDVKGRIKKLFE